MFVCTDLINIATRLSPEAAGEVDRDVEETRVSRDGLVSDSGWKDAFECDGVSRSLEKDSNQPGQDSHSTGLPSWVLNTHMQLNLRCPNFRG